LVQPQQIFRCSAHAAIAQYQLRNPALISSVTVDHACRVAVPRSRSSPSRTVIPFPAWWPHWECFQTLGFRGFIIFLIASWPNQTARRSTSGGLSPNHRRHLTETAQYASFLAEYPWHFRRQRARRTLFLALGKRLAFLDDVRRISGFSSRLMGLGFSVHLDSRDVAAFARGPLLNLAWNSCCRWRS